MTRSTARHLPAVLAAAALVAFTASPAVAGADRVRADGPLVRYGSAVPEGATARVQAVYTSAGSSIVTLHVTGLLPDTEYGAHAHVGACGATDPLASGGHFQHVPSPTTPTDPAYANPANEIWLDLTTDDDGNGAATAKVDWQFEPGRRAASVVLHARHTHTGQDGPAGTAGARLACLTVPF